MCMFVNGVTMYTFHRGKFKVEILLILTCWAGKTLNYSVSLISNRNSYSIKYKKIVAATIHKTHPLFYLSNGPYAAFTIIYAT